MNEWTEKSIQLVKARGYLDRLHQIYPIQNLPERNIPSETIQLIRTLYEKRDRVGLINLLLELEKFPVKDPYIGFLRKDASSIEKNPQTITRITNRIFAMDFNQLIAGISEPKESNRMMGQLFRNWLYSLDYEILAGDDFINYEGIAICRGSDKALLDFAGEYLSYNNLKRPDMIIKNGETYFIGEAKFVGDYGGNQNAKIKEAISVAEDTSGSAVKVAIVDGVCWIESNEQMYKSITSARSFVFSGILLKEFIESFS